jgi:hypothetical protein
MLELAQKGIGEEDSLAHLTYSQGDLEIYSQDDMKRVLPGHLTEVITEAGEPDELNNLYFYISQDNPVRRVEINIGPGDWTTYRVESDDQTWAFGRYHELTDRLLIDRCMYAKGAAPRPEVLHEGTDDNWRPAAWEPVKDWRIALSVIAPSFAALLPAVAVLSAALVAFTYYASNGNTKNDKLDHQQLLQLIHSAGTNKAIIIGMSLSYLIGLFAVRRWLRSFLKSAVVLRKISLLSQFNFQNKKSDTVILASFYVSFATLIITALAMLLR